MVPDLRSRFVNDGFVLGINNVDTGLSRYHNGTIPGFPNGGVEQATTASYANNSFSLGASGSNNHGHIDAGYIGHTLGNVSTPVSVFDQNNYAAFTPQFDNGGYPHRYANLNVCPSNNTNATAFGMAHGYNGSTTDGATLGAPSTGTTFTRRGILPASTPGFIGGQYSQYEDDVFPAGHTNRNLNPSNNANAMALGMSHDIGSYVTGDVTLGAPSTGMTTNMSSTVSSPTPGSVDDRYSHYGDGVELAGHANRVFFALDNASARAFEMTSGSSGYVNDGNAFGARAMGNTTTMGSSLLAFAPRSMHDHDIYDSAGLYDTHYPNVNPNLSNNALPVDIGTGYGSSSNVSNRTAFGVSSTGGATTMTGNILGSTFGHEGSIYLQHSDAVYPTDTDLHAANPNLSSNTLPTDTGTALSSNSHATNNTATGSADGSNRNAAANDTALAAQPSGNPPTLRSTFSSSAPGPVKGPDGRARWPCTNCSKTFSRPSDVTRHAKKHSGELPYQCSAPGCKFKGTYRSDKLVQHKSHSGH